MSPYAAVIYVVGGLCALDLLLTLGVIRRLRTHTTVLGQLRGLEEMGGPPPLPAGASVGGFTAATQDGARCPPSSSTWRSWWASSPPNCDGCMRLLPSFLELAPAIAGGREQVLAVVTGVGDEVEEYVAKLRRVAQVVVEEPQGPVARAFSVNMVPAFVLVGPGGTVVASGSTLDALPVPVAG